MLTQTRAGLVIVQVFPRLLVAVRAIQKLKFVAILTLNMNN